MIQTGLVTTTSQCQIFSTGPSIAEILQFFLKTAATTILDFWNREILLASGVQKIEIRELAKFRQNRSIGYEDIKIFQDGDHTPSWIRLVHIWTTYSEYLGVSITLQNLVMIDAVVYII